MTTTIKKKIISGVALLCTLMLLIGILPTSVFRNNRADAAGETYQSDYVYFDISNITDDKNRNEWENKNIFLYLFKSDGWNTTFKLNHIVGTTYGVQMGSGYNYGGMSMFFVLSESDTLNWDGYIKLADYRRTNQMSVPTSANGKIFSWNGSSTTSIDTRNTFDLTYTDASIGQVIGGSDVPTNAIKPSTAQEQYHDSSIFTNGTTQSNDNVNANYQITIKNYKKNNEYNRMYWYGTVGSGTSARQVNNGWPGQEFKDIGMVTESGDNLIINFSAAYNINSLNIIFTSSSNGSTATSQYPSSGGQTIEVGKSYTVDVSEGSPSISIDNSVSRATYKVGNYSYTGKYLTYMADFYDYISDYEIDSGYGNINDSSSSGWTDQNKKFNNLISSYGLTYPLYFGCFYYDLSGSDGNDNDTYTTNNKNTILSNKGTQYNNFYWLSNISKRNDQTTAISGLVDKQLNSQGDLTQNNKVLPYFSSEWFDKNLVNTGNQSSFSDTQIVNYKINGTTIMPNNSEGNFSTGGETFTIKKKYEVWFHGTTGKDLTVVNKGADGTYWNADYNNGDKTYFSLTIENWGKYPDKVEIGLKNKYGSTTYYEMTKVDNQYKWELILDYSTSYDKTITDTGNTPVAKYWKNISFPFYQVKINKDNNGNSYASGEEPVYYQFNSRDNVSLYLDTNNNRLVEHSTAIMSQNTDTTGQTRGFYPFNKTNNSPKNNLAFGTKFNIEFTLTEDGKIGNVPTTFEFMGDDDVWVFIDGKLALDMGGAHKDSYGKIDFSTRKSTVESSVDISNNKKLDGSTVTPAADNLAANTSSLVTDITEIFADSYNAKTGKYDTKTKHTLTMFYMERGMFESDLFVRFNFSLNNNFVVKNQVQVHQDTNPGFVDKTYVAANDDVFTYLIKNNPLSDSLTDTSGNGLTYPVNEDNNRIVNITSSSGVLGTSGPLAETTTVLSQKRENGTTKTGNYTGTVGTLNNVSDTLFERYDDFVIPKLVGTTDSTGNFGLLYGQTAVFRKQFAKNSIMYLEQQNALKELNKNGTDSSFGKTLEAQTSTRASARNVDDYYTTSWVLTDTDNKTLGSGTNNIVTDGRVTTDGSDKFKFSNETASGEILDIVGVENTVQFTNVTKVGSLQITKTLADSWDSSTQKFAIKVKFTDIFGNENVDFEQADYWNTTYTVNGESKSMGYDNGYGVIYIQKDQTAIISGIPVGTNYEIIEDAHSYFTNQGITSSTGVIAADTPSTSTVTNQRITSGQLILVKDIIAEDETTTPVLPIDRTNYHFDFVVEFEFDGVDFESYNSNSQQSVQCWETMYAWDGQTNISTVADWVDYDNTDVEWTPVADKTNTYRATFEVYPDHPVKITRIPYGTKYTVTEQDEPDDGYQYYSTKVGSTIKTDPWQNIISQSSEVITITNQKLKIPTGSLTITKVDADDNSIKLSGAEFTLYKNPSCTSRYGEPQTTGTDGTATFSNIPYGTYYLKETKAPGGYQSNGDVITVTVNSSTVTLTGGNTITNNKIVLPSTGGTGSDTTNYMFIGLAVIMIAGAAFLVFNRKVIFCKSKH
ncbi:MAG: SpaA isopeptide-forming pilin-related protein [Acutalibacteraceae bacterium]